MSAQDRARFMGTRMSTGSIWKRRPAGSVMYMPSGCLAASMTTLTTLAASSAAGRAMAPSDRTRAAQGARRARSSPRAPPRPAKAAEAAKGDSMRPRARALAKWGHMATPVTATVWVSRLNSCAARLYCAREPSSPRWDSRRRSVWKAMGMTRDWKSWGPAVSMILTPRTARSRGTSRIASASRGRVARQATTMQMSETRVLAR